MNLPEVKWGIVGCGKVTEKKSGPAFNNIEGSSLVAVMRRNRDLAQDYAKRHKVPRFYDDADDLINDPEVNAVYIATPPGSHEELALKVAAAGKPCYVEKPMARNSTETGRMVEAFEKANLPLFVAYYRRALPQFLSALQWINSGKLGLLREARYEFTSPRQKNPAAHKEWRCQPELSGGGIFWDLGSHVLDLFDFWLGPISQVTGSRRNLTGFGVVEDIAKLNAWAGKVAVSASFNFIAPFPKDVIELVFENGIITANAFSGSSLNIFQEGKDPIIEEHSTPSSIQEPLIQQIVDSLRKGTPSSSTGSTAHRTNQVLDQILLLEN